jgi:hypothetical protein
MVIDSGEHGGVRGTDVVIPRIPEGALKVIDEGAMSLPHDVAEGPLSRGSVSQALDYIRIPWEVSHAPDYIEGWVEWMCLAWPTRLICRTSLVCDTDLSLFVGFACTSPKPAPAPLRR